MTDPAITTLLGGAFALLFASAAFHKIRGLAQFAAVFSAYRITPAGWPLAPLVPLIEFSLAVGLLFPATRAAAALGGALLLLLYAAAIALNLQRGRRDLSCGCGGPDERRVIAPWMVARNAALAMVLAAATLSPGPRPLQAVDLLTVAGGMAVAALLYMSADRLLGRILPRTALWERGP